MTIKELHNLNQLIGEFNKDYIVESLDRGSLDALNKQKAEVAFYWYGCGSFEGSGELIFLREDKWHLIDISHCSCYEPDKIIEEYDGDGFNSIEDLLSRCSNEYKIRIKPLIDLIKLKGYGPAKPDDILIGIF